MQLITSTILINECSFYDNAPMQPSDWHSQKTYMYARATGYSINLFHLVTSFKIPEIKYILEEICQKWKCESIQSASRQLKVCLTLFIYFVIIRTTIMNCMHTCLADSKFINTCVDVYNANKQGQTKLKLCRYM